jgi:hypothetical protein
MSPIQRGELENIVNAQIAAIAVWPRIVLAALPFMTF